MTKPQEIRNCGLCGGRLWLAVRKSELGGFYWRYECDKCKEGFTTEESDLLSMRQFKYLSGISKYTGLVAAAIKETYDRKNEDI